LIAVVLGASGYMGSNLAPALAAHGWRVRAVARNAALLEAREWQGVECHSADVLQPETLGPVLEGADVVFYLVHMMWTGGDFVPVERRAAEKNHDLPARWVEGSIACREALFKVMQHFGRDGDFFSYRPLWWLRRAFDWLIGGPSFRTGRGDPDTLRMGDIVDGWRVPELCAYCHPAGFWGLLYWYAHLPLYGPLVHGAVAEIARRAELLEGPRAAA